LIAGFYNYGELEFLIRILSIIFLIEPLGLVFRALLQKELNFPILEKVSITRNIFQLVIIILFTFLGF